MSAMLKNEEWNKAIASLYDDKELLEKTSDCQVVAGGQSFLAHRWILAAQSSVFREKFKKKRGENAIDFEVPTEFAAQAVEVAIRYCYNGYVDDDMGPELVNAVIKVAHNYGMSDLEEDMKTRRSLRYSPEERKRKCTTYLDVNKSVSKAAKWMLSKGRTVLAEEFLKSTTQWEMMEDRTREGTVARRNRNLFLLHNYDETADCWIQAGDETFPAHRCVLMAHSLRFRELFTDPTTEAYGTGVVHENDFPTAVLDVLIYCYFGGYISNAVQYEVPMFRLAAKYSVTTMKKRLEKRLIQKLGRDNLLEMAILAGEHSSDELKQACIVFIAVREYVEESAEWDTLQRERPGLAAELLHGVNRILRRELNEAKNVIPLPFR